MRYWLMKSEPSDVSIDDLTAMPKQTVAWYGIRNYQARTDPAPMALVISGGTYGALEELSRQFTVGCGPALEAAGIARGTR